MAQARSAGAVGRRAAQSAPDAGSKDAGRPQNHLGVGRELARRGHGLPLPSGALRLHPRVRHRQGRLRGRHATAAHDSRAAGACLASRTSHLDRDAAGRRARHGPSPDARSSRRGTAARRSRGPGSALVGRQSQSCPERGIFQGLGCPHTDPVHSSQVGRSGRWPGAPGRAALAKRAGAGAACRKKLGRFAEFLRMARAIPTIVFLGKSCAIVATGILRNFLLN